MIGKIRQSSIVRLCACSTHKGCTHCKKKDVKSHINVGHAQRLLITIKIHPKNKPTIWCKEKRTTTKKEPKQKEKYIIKDNENQRWEILTIQAPLYSYHAETTRRNSRLYDWCQKQRATRELKNYYKRERKREKKEKLEREKARKLIEKEFLQKLYYKPESLKDKRVFLKPQRKERCRCNDDISNKFVNCCYRLCCQFYCYLTCIIIIAFVIILL